MTSEDIQKLRAPFPASIIHVKIQSLNKARDKAMLVKYLQHTDVLNRLEEVDPAWHSKVTWRQEFLGERNSPFCVSIALTIKGVTRENVGEGDDPKSAYSDAIKRAAMLFGVGRYLYDEETQWVSYNEQQDKYRKWTVNDFRTNPKPVATPASTQTNQAPKSQAPFVGGKAIPTVTEKQVTRLYAIAHSKGLSHDDVRAQLEEWYEIDSAKFLTPLQYDKICNYMLGLGGDRNGYSNQ